MVCDVINITVYKFTTPTRRLESLCGDVIVPLFYRLHNVPFEDFFKINEDTIIRACNVFLRMIYQPGVSSECNLNFEPSHRF